MGGHPTTFSPTASYIAAAALANGARSVLPVDIDLDGDLDALVASQLDGHVAW